MSHLSKAKSLLFNADGKLTRDLVLTPGKFGLGLVPERLKPDAVTTLVCGYCSTGCGLKVHLKDQQAINLSPDPDYPVNMGMACTKGWEALTPMAAADRGTTPLLRNSAGNMEAIGWPEAIATFCERMKAIQGIHGPESVAFLSTGQIVTEEMALLGALTKFGMGILHGDGNTRQCMATAAVAYKQAFGFDAPPFTYNDFEESDVMVFVGANPCIAHPIMWERVCRNPHSPEIIVVDPRQTETAMAATCHIRLKPKSDLYLFYAIAQVLIENGGLDDAFISDHTEGFEVFAEHVAPYTPESVAEVTGITAAAIRRLAETIHAGKRVSFWWTMGVNQSYQGVRTAQSLINLALMTGNIGRPGTGANSITGQANAMGSRLFSNTTTLLGGRDFKKREDRQRVADILHLDESAIPAQDSLPYHKILEGVRSGSIKALWVICTNPLHSWIERPELKKALKNLDLLVVQDIYPTTETAVAADLFLPAAGWGEKEGTFINSERRIGLVKKVRRAPGQALADFHIFKLIAEAWGCGEQFRAWESPEAVFSILQACSKGQPCDFSGIAGYEALERAGGIQWPQPDGDAEVETERRLFADGRFFHSNGRATFLFDAPAALPEPTDAAYPFFLLTGRGSSSQWHTQTRTSKSAVLRKLYSNQAYVEINIDDAARIDVAHEDTVRVSSRRGTVSLLAYVTPSIAPGQLFIPMHYEETNLLTKGDFDPYSAQPSYKACAVSLEKDLA